MNYRLAPLAIPDLDQIATYIVQRSRFGAYKFIETLEHQFRLLAERPGIGRSRPDLRPVLRSWPHRSYIILYHIVDTGVEIVRVIHGARDLAAVLNEASPGNNEPSE